MLKLTADVPFFVPLRTGKEDIYTLERGSLIRVANMVSRHGAVQAVVMAGKYEGLKGNIPASFCAADTMSVI